MLVLTRKNSEAIKIGDDVTVTLVEIRGERVRIGIQAPEHVAVYRQEVWLKIKATEHNEHPETDKDHHGN